MDAETNNGVVNATNDGRDENIVKVNELDAENNSGDLNEAQLISCDVDNMSKDVNHEMIKV